MELIFFPSDMIFRKGEITDLYPSQIRRRYPGLLETTKSYSSFSFTEHTRLTVIVMVSYFGTISIEIKNTPRRRLWLRLWWDLRGQFKDQFCLQAKGKFHPLDIIYSFKWPDMPLVEFGHLLSHSILKHLVWTALPPDDPDYSKQPETPSLSEVVWAPDEEPGRLYIIYNKSLRFEVLAQALWAAHAHLINLLNGRKPRRKLSAILHDQQRYWQEMRDLYHVL